MSYNILGKERRSQVTGKKVRDYVDNKKFTKAVMQYNEQYEKDKLENKPQKKMPDIIGHGIMKIAEGLGTRHNFRGYTYVDEMISDAMVQGVYAVTRFNIEKIKLSFIDTKRYFVFMNPNNYKRPIRTEDEMKEFILGRRKNQIKNITFAGRKVKEPNAYGYLTLVMWRSFTARIKEEAEQQKIIEDLMMDPSYNFYEQDVNENDHGVDISKENAVDFYFDGK